MIAQKLQIFSWIVFFSKIIVLVMKFNYYICYKNLYFIGQVRKILLGLGKKTNKCKNDRAFVAIVLKVKLFLLESGNHYLLILIRIKNNICSLVNSDREIDSMRGIPRWRYYLCGCRRLVFNL